MEYGENSKPTHTNCIPDDQYEDEGAPESDESHCHFIIYFSCEVDFCHMLKGTIYGIELDGQRVCLRRR